MFFCCVFRHTLGVLEGLKNDELTHSESEDCPWRKKHPAVSLHNQTTTAGRPHHTAPSPVMFDDGGGCG